MPGTAVDQEVADAHGRAVHSYSVHSEIIKEEMVP
jgi:hypothetical protein